MSVGREEEEDQINISPNQASVHEQNVYWTVQHNTKVILGDEFAASTLFFQAVPDSVSFSLQTPFVSSPSGMREGDPVFLSVFVQ